MLQQRNRAHELRTVIHASDHQPQRLEEYLPFEASGVFQTLGHRLHVFRTMHPQFIRYRLGKGSVNLRRRVVGDESERFAKLREAVHTRLHDVDSFRQPRNVEEACHERPQLLRAHRVNVLTVHPLELLRIEYRCGRIQAIEGEVLDRVLTRENVAAVGRGPSQQGQVVDHCIGEKPLIGVRRNRCRSVALRQFRPVLAEDEGDVGEFGDGPAERAIDQHLPMRIRQMLLGPNHVRDAHVMIVDDHGEVVRRQAIGAHQNEIAERLLLPGHFAANLIVDRHVAVIGNMKSDRVWSIVVAAVVPMRQIVVRRTILLLRLLPLFFELLLRAVAAIGDALFEKLIGDRAIQRGALRLSERAFIPLQP